MCFFHSHTHRKLFWLKKINKKSIKKKFGCGLIFATSIGSLYACQKLIYEPIRLKFGIRIPNNWGGGGGGGALLTICECGFFVIATSIEIFLAAKAKYRTNQAEI